MKKIILFGPLNAKTSLGIYTNALTKMLTKKSDIKIIDQCRHLENCGFFTSIIKGIFDIPKIVFPGKYDENTILLAPHSATLFPPLFLSTNAKKIHIVHDFFYYDEEFFSTLGWFHRNILYPLYYLKIHKFLYRVAFRHADAIVAISQATKKEIIQKFGEEFREKIHVIHNGMNQDQFQKNTIHPRITSFPNKKYILYIGSELDRKNLKNIIAGFSIFHQKYDDYILVKAPVESWGIYRQKTLDYIQKNGLEIEKNIFLLDEYFTKNELASLYQHAEVFVFPSLKEGFGFPIIESQACGTPVITSNLEPMSELVPYKNFLVNPNNPEEIAEKLEKITQNPELRKKLSDEGESFSKKFSWENTADSFLKLFQKIEKN